jgi:hypothetical protein
MVDESVQITVYVQQTWQSPVSEPIHSQEG